MEERGRTTAFRFLAVTVFLKAAVGAAAASDLVHPYAGKVDDLCVDGIYAQLKARCPREP